jgi:hypothetical protein
VKHILVLEKNSVTKLELMPEFHGYYRMHKNSSNFFNFIIKYKCFSIIIHREKNLKNSNIKTNSKCQT